MRDILFKAKRIDNGEWVEGSLIDSGNHYQVFIYPHDDSASTMSCKTLVYHGMVAVDSNTICRYSGLQDKNGQKIWENDIIRELDGGMDDIPRKVCWDETGMMFKCPLVRSHWAYGNNDCDLWLMQSKNIEVISNIFDNAELLKGGD